MLGAGQGLIGSAAGGRETPSGTERCRYESTRRPIPSVKNRLTRYAHRANGGASRDREDGRPHSREHMHVAMRVDMSHSDAHPLQHTELSGALGDDLGGREPSGERTCDEPPKGIELARAWMAQAWYVFRPGNRATGGQIEVQADG